ADAPLVARMDENRSLGRAVPGPCDRQRLGDAELPGAGHVLTRAGAASGASGSSTRMKSHRAAPSNANTTPAPSAAVQPNCANSSAVNGVPTIPARLPPVLSTPSADDV